MIPKVNLQEEREQVKTLLDLYRTDLNRWECEFLTNLAKVFRDPLRVLSAKQSEKLAEIWARTGGSEDDNQEGRWA